MLSILYCIMAGSTVMAQSLTVPLPAGETNLIDVGMYRVFWQTEKQRPVEMPVSWSGHFEAQAGISYQDRGRVLGRRALLMHSPWREAPGKTWVDYEIKLPELKPVWLKFGIAIDEKLAGTNRGDGVTFASILSIAGRRQQLMREHHATSQWQDFEFDLSRYAGKTIVLRLQVEPGPQNDAAFDFALFGDARIEVGSGEGVQREQLRELIESKAYQTTKNADLTKLANRHDQGIVPGNLLSFENTLEKLDESRWQFSCRGDDCEVVYDWTPNNGTLDDFQVRVNGGRPFKPAMGGGITIDPDHANASSNMWLQGGRPIKIERDQDQLAVTWEYELSSQKLIVHWNYSILGKALVVAARCDQPLISQFTLGEVGPAQFRREYSVPYLEGKINYLPAQNVFVCRYLDWTQSHGSDCPQGVATYATNTDGKRNLLNESGYISVSPNLGEVLPNIPFAPSRFRDQLAPRIVLDIWNHHRGTYRGDAANLEALKDLGVDHLAVIVHDWQRHGYDVKLPDHLPANPKFGGDAGMIAFGATANRLNYLWSLHENYIDFYPYAPSFDRMARVLNSDGSPAKAWFNETTRTQSFALKSNRARDFAEKNSPEIHRRFNTTAAYLDVHTCVAPWHLLDHDARQPLAAMSLSKIEHESKLFDFMRNSHQGPLLGEGGKHFYWAGQCDGVEAEVTNGETHFPLLDFDLLKIHPQMVNHGMGYYERWFREGYSLRWGIHRGSMQDIDKYRAQTLAYGHAGFIGGDHVDNLAWVVREHHVMHPVQRLYASSIPVEISYELDGQFVPASVALVVGDTWRQRIRYKNGLTLWVNWRAEPWVVEGHKLPQWGYLAKGPDTEARLALRDGKYSDYVECKEYIFADARTESTLTNPDWPKSIEPRLRDFKHLGGNRASITYEWIVNEELEENYQCFVHGVHGHGTLQESIAFQQDHDLVRRTSGWRKGSVVVDGPYDLIVDDKYDNYDLFIGLYQRERLKLKGVRDDADRIMLAKLKLQRNNGRITDIVAEKIKPGSQSKLVAQPVDFTAHLNPPGTWVDFRKVGTNGSFKLEFGPKRLVLFPYPRDKLFQIRLDLKKLAPLADQQKVQVTALSAGTQQELGPADIEWKNNQLVITVGMPNAGRYVVTWD